MSNVEIKNLFFYNRFPDNEAKIFLAAIYFPFGVVLFLLRVILALILVIFSQVLPDSPLIQHFLTYLACLCFGITISVENSKKKENVAVYISNNLSIFDHLAVSKAVGLVLPLNKTPLQSLSSLGIKDFGNVDNSELFRKNFETITKEKKIPVHLCPEEASTNGRAVLKFNPKYFQYFEKVQPICITVKRPFLDISLSTLGSSYIEDIIYFMYAPFTNYVIKFLPSLEKKSLSGDEFAEIIRQNIASGLKVEASNFTASDLAEWAKRRLAEERRRAIERANSQTTRLPNPELARMATQVKEVLPHVPVSAIYNDLAVTRSVDTTITNILEGRLRFVPETPPQSTSSLPSTPGQPSASFSSSPGNPANSSSSHLSTGAAAFSKSASERTKSFQERKELLIAAARRRYIEKYRLDLPL